MVVQARAPPDLNLVEIHLHEKAGTAMQSQKALIERSNRQSLKQVDVQVTITDSTSGSQSWHGEFMSRTADGFLPSERIWLTLDNGQRGMANISETHFNSRTPEATLIQFMGKGPLA